MTDLDQLLEKVQERIRSVKDQLPEPFKTELAKLEAVEEFLSTQVGIRNAATSKSPDSSSSASAAEPRRPKTLVDVIKEFVNASPGKEFTTADFYEELRRRNPNANRDSVKSLATRLVESGFLVKIQEGNGKTLPVFRKKMIGEPWWTHGPKIPRGDCSLVSFFACRKQGVRRERRSYQCRFFHYLIGRPTSQAAHLATPK